MFEIDRRRADGSGRTNSVRNTEQSRKLGRVIRRISARCDAETAQDRNDMEDGQ